MFFQYPWNNFLHHSVLSMIDSIYGGKHDKLKLTVINNTTKLQKQSKPKKKKKTQLITECKLLDLLCDGVRDNEEEVKKPNGLRKGYMGHVTKISVILIESAKEDSDLAKLLSEHKRWQEYINTTLKGNQQLLPKLFFFFFLKNFFRFQKKKMQRHKPVRLWLRNTQLTKPTCSKCNNSSNNNNKKNNSKIGSTQLQMMHRLVAFLFFFWFFFLRMQGNENQILFFLFKKKKQTMKQKKKTKRRTGKKKNPNTFETTNFILWIFVFRFSSLSQ